MVFFSLMAGCSVGPPYVPPCIEVPAAWKSTQDKTCISNVDGEVSYLDYWWQVFDDTKLEELENLALKNNKDLYVAFERIQESRALMGIAAADLYPQLNLNPFYSNTGELVKVYKAPTPGGEACTLLNQCNGKNLFRAHELFYFLPVNLSYEVDLWGKIRDQYTAAKDNWLAQSKDYEFVMLTLTGNLAIAYYQLRAADAQIDLLAEVLKTRQKAYEINQARYEEKITFYADVALAAEEIDTVRLQYQEAVRQRRVLENQIAVLIGTPPSEFCLEHMPLKGLPPCIPEGLPSEILLRRPDLEEAEYRIQAEHALVKQAYSLFFPSLTLTATGGSESPVFKEFLKWLSRYWSFGGQSNQIIFDGFRTCYNLDLQISRFKEASGTYQQQVLVAFQEVENALTDLNSYAQQYDLAVATAQLAQKVYQLYFDRYKSGIIYYIDVTNTERDLLNYQLTVNTLQGFRFVETVQLIKALGGGW